MVENTSFTHSSDQDRELIEEGLSVITQLIVADITRDEAVIKFALKQAQKFIEKQPREFLKTARDLGWQVPAPKKRSKGIPWSAKRNFKLRDDFPHSKISRTSGRGKWSKR